MSEDSRLIDIIKANSDSTGHAQIRLVHMIYSKKYKWETKKHGNMSTYFRNNKKYVFHRKKPGHHEVSLSPLSGSFSPSRNKSKNELNTKKKEISDDKRNNVNNRIGSQPTKKWNSPKGPVTPPRVERKAHFVPSRKPMSYHTRPRMKKPEPRKRVQWPPPKKKFQNPIKSVSAPKPPPRRIKTTSNKQMEKPFKFAPKSSSPASIGVVSNPSSRDFGNAKGSHYQSSPYTSSMRSKVGIFTRKNEKSNVSSKTRFAGSKPSTKKNNPRIENNVDEDRFKEWKSTLSKNFYINPNTGFEVKGNEIKYPNKNRYVGEIDYKTNKRNGKGTYYFSSSGEKYVGEFVMDKREGYGVQYYSTDKVMYKGQWKQDAFHGKGTYCYPNGEKYSGEWRMNKKHGKGTYSYVKGEYEEYNGDWVDNMKDGIGILKYRGNKGEIEATWKRNQITKINNCVFK